MMTIYYENNNNTHTLKIIGHAGVIGNDGSPNYICSAASMLFYTLLTTLEIMEADGEVEIVNMVDIPGDALLIVKPFAGGWEKLKIVVDTIINGYETLSDRYPDNVDLRI